MKKKIVALVICLVFIFGSIAGTASIRAGALGNVNISYETIKAYIGTIEERLSALPAAERTKIFKIGQVYFETDQGIDTLISIINDPSATIPEQLQGFFGLLGNYHANKDQLTFALSFIKSIDPQGRASALEGFANKIAYTGLANDEMQAFTAIYHDLVGEDFCNLLEREHNITPAVMVTLVSCIKGTFVITDNEKDGPDLAYKTIDSQFGQRLRNNISAYFDSVNSVKIDSGGAVIKAIINSLNTSLSNEMKANIKLALQGFDMYTRYTTSGGPGGYRPPMPTSTPTETPMPTETPTPTPSAEPTSAPTTEPTASPSAQPTVIPAPELTESAAQAVAKFEDVSGHWSKAYVAQLVERNVFYGYPNDSFQPEQHITRQEMATVLVRALGLAQQAEQVDDYPYDDLDQIADWSKKAISLLADMGICKGFEDNTFRPHELTTREQLTAFIARALTVKPRPAQLPFADADTISDWAKDSIATAYSAGIIKGYDDNLFRPQNWLTRGQAASIIYNYMYVEGLL